MINLKRTIKQLHTKGFMNIFGANAINKALSFVVNLLIVRALSQKNYGIFSSVNNTYSIFILCNGIGTLSGLLLYGSENRSEAEKRSYFKYGIRVALFADVILAALIFWYGRSGVGVQSSGFYLQQMAFLPILDYCGQYFQMLARGQKENRKYSILLNISSISYSVFVLWGAAAAGIQGAVIGRYLSSLLSTLAGAFLYRRDIIQIKNADSLLVSKRTEFCKYSFVMGINSAISTVLYLIDVFLVGQLLGDPVVLAKYKLATLIPDNLGFIPMSIIITFLPYFAENNQNAKWLKKNVKKVLRMNVVLNGGLALSLIVLARPLIITVWGNEYSESIPAFRILCLSFFVLCSFKQLATNVLSILRLVKECTIVSVSSLIADIVLDCIFIKRFGAVGAAFATLIVSCIASVLATYYLAKGIQRIESENNRYNPTAE